MADIVEQATVGVAQTDLDGHLEMVNTRFCEIVGRTAEELRGMRMQAVTHADDVAENDRLFRKLVATGEPFQMEKRYVRPDGSNVWVSNHVSLIHDDHGQPTSAVAVVLDITQRKLAARHREILLGELDHRVRNTLSTVHAIAQETLAQSKDVAGFREAFLSRLESLSSTHDLLSDHGWRGAGLRDLVHAELATFADAKPARADLRGEDVRLNARESLAVGLALHELATNAGKHGALSAPDGKVHVRWDVDTRQGTRWVRLVWAEVGGPAVREPVRPGFGTRLVMEGIEQDLGGRVSLDFAPTGVSCVIEFPMKEDASA